MVIKRYNRGASGLPVEGNNFTPPRQVFILTLFVFGTIALNRPQRIVAFAHTLVLTVRIRPGHFFCYYHQHCNGRADGTRYLRTASRRRDDYVRYSRLTHDGEDKMCMLHREVKVTYLLVSRGLAIEGHGRPSF